MGFLVLHINQSFLKNFLVNFFNLRYWVIHSSILLVFSTVTFYSVAEEALPIRHFFEHSKVVSMKISPDGKHIAFSYEEGSEIRLAVMSLADSKVLSSFTFGENMHVIDFHWANDKRVLMEVAKVTGNLVKIDGVLVDLYAANIDGKKRDLIFKSGMSVYRILNILPNDPDKILIGKYHWAEKSGMRAFTLDINRAKERYLDQQPEGLITDLLADNLGNIRMGVEYEKGDTLDADVTYLHIKEDGKWSKLNLNSKRDKPIIIPLKISSDNHKAYFLSNFDVISNDTLGLFEYNFETKSINLITRHQDSDVEITFFGHDGEVLAVNYVSGSIDYDFVDSQHPDSLLLAGLKRSFPEEKVSISSFSQNGELALFKVSGDRNPGQFYIYDSLKKQARYLASAMPGLDSKKLVPMREVKFKSRDGIDLYAFLTLPKKVDKNLPLIVNVHGGPYGVYDSWGFHPEAQFFANRGYATLQVNYRGSGGYGENFEKLGRLQWGKAMQDDITDATHWAIKEGFADPKRICIYGGSYGGYAAIWGVIKEPDLYQCSVGYVGVYDMQRFFNGDGSDASRSETIKDYLKTHIGEGKDYLSSISPVDNVHKIKADLFIIHGSKDVRVPIVHANNLKMALDKIGKPYKWMVKEEGHGFYQVDNRETLYTEMLNFFEKNIGKGAL